eukprot:11126430-Alexandrium_andersonii.AAC.1
MRSYGREPALAAGHRPPQQPSQQGLAAALLGTASVVQHQGDADAGLVAVLHAKRDEASPTEGRLVILHSTLPASPIEGLVV